MIFNRALTDQECEALSKTTVQKIYTKDSWDADPVNPNNTSNRTPRYRGLTYGADKNATGTISTGQGTNLKMNNNDFVIFRG